VGKAAYAAASLVVGVIPRLLQGKRADAAKPRTAPVFMPGGFGAVKCREAAHPMDAPPA